MVNILTIFFFSKFCVVIEAVLHTCEQTKNPMNSNNVFNCTFFWAILNEILKKDYWNLLRALIWFALTLKFNREKKRISLLLGRKQWTDGCNSHAIKKTSLSIQFQYVSLFIWQLQLARKTKTYYWLKRIRFNCINIVVSPIIISIKHQCRWIALVLHEWSLYQVEVFYKIKIKKRSVFVFTNGSCS